MADRRRGPRRHSSRPITDERHRRVYTGGYEGDEYVPRRPDAVTPYAPNAGDPTWTSDFAQGQQFEEGAFREGYQGPRMRDMNYAQGNYGGETNLNWPYGGYSDQEEWLEEGPHTGRGPAGYRRSDERIEEEACARLTRHGWVDATNIEVEVEDGIVTLRGEVEDRRSKRLAEDAVGSIAGVHDVMNMVSIPRD